MTPELQRRFDEIEQYTQSISDKYDRLFREIEHNNRLVEIERHRRQSNYPNKLVTVLERACNVGYDLAIHDGMFILVHPQESGVKHWLFPEFSDSANRRLIRLEEAVTRLESEEAEVVHRVVYNHTMSR